MPAPVQLSGSLLVDQRGSALPQLFVGEDNLVFLVDVINDVNGAAQPFISPTATIYALDGTTVIVSGTAMTQVNGPVTANGKVYDGPGNYYALLLHSTQLAEFVAGQSYIVDVIGTNGAGALLHKRLTLPAAWDKN